MPTPRVHAAERDRVGDQPAAVDKYPQMFDAILADSGIETVPTGIHMPRTNAVTER